MKKNILKSEPALKFENYASFKQIYTLKLFVAFKMAYSFCFSWGWNLEFFQKKFYNINYGLRIFSSQLLWPI